MSKKHCEHEAVCFIYREMHTLYGGAVDLSEICVGDCRDDTRTHKNKAEQRIADVIAELEKRCDGAGGA